MSIYSAKHRIVTATILVAGLQCEACCTLCRNGSARHDALCRAKNYDPGRDPNQTEQNPEVQGAASTITMKAQLKDDGYLLRWTGFPEVWRPPAFWLT